MMDNNHLGDFQYPVVRRRYTMKKIEWFSLAIATIAIYIVSAPILAAEVTKQQIKGLDEQVQDIKKDVLGISAKLNQLEEKLLYPSNTQVSFFVSLPKNTSFLPDAVKIKLNNRDIAHYIYSHKEVKALKKGGVHRVYTGNVRTGEHTLVVEYMGKAGLSKVKDTASYSVKKGVRPQFVEIILQGNGVNFKTW